MKSILISAALMTFSFSVPAAMTLSWGAPTGQLPAEKVPIGEALAEVDLVKPELIRKQSPHSVEVTLTRLSSILTEKGVSIFARIDHQANAASVKSEIMANQVLIFGNPTLGSPLIQSEPLMGLELPMRVLAYEDNAHQTWLVYEMPRMMAVRRNVSDQTESIHRMTETLGALTDEAIAP